MPSAQALRLLDIRDLRATLSLIKLGPTNDYDDVTSTASCPHLMLVDIHSEGTEWVMLPVESHSQKEASHPAHSRTGSERAYTHAAFWHIGSAVAASFLLDPPPRERSAFQQRGPEDPTALEGRRDKGMECVHFMGLHWLR